MNQTLLIIECFYFTTCCSVSVVCSPFYLSYFSFSVNVKSFLYLLALHCFRIKYTLPHKIQLTETFTLKIEYEHGTKCRHGTSRMFIFS